MERREPLTPPLDGVTSERTAAPLGAPNGTSAGAPGAPRAFRPSHRDREAPSGRSGGPDPTAARWLRLFDGGAWLRVRITVDLAVLAAACFAALAVAPLPPRWMFFAIGPIMLIALASTGRYRQRAPQPVLDGATTGFGCMSMGIMLLVTAQLLLTGQASSGGFLASSWVFAISGMAGCVVALSAARRALCRRGRLALPTLVVGAGAVGAMMGDRLRRRPDYGLKAVGCLDSDPDAVQRDANLPLLGGLADLEAVVARYGIRNVVIASPETSEVALLALIARCDALGVDTMVVPNLSAAINHQTRFEYIGTQPLLNLRAVERVGWRFRCKRGIDCVLALIFLVALTPLLAAIAIAVKLTSSGPAFFRQYRTGRDGVLFELLKFRTMSCDEPDAVFELGAGMAPGGVEGIDRRTRIGRLLRSTSLDELPQLINVLRGDMSLVGPRPERPEYADMFREQIDRYHDRHRVRSGITGWAQVHGMRGQTPLADRVELDNFYIEHWSLAIDAKILLLTLPALLRGS